MIVDSVDESILLPAAPPGAPLAERRAHRTVLHGTVLEDEWFWLRDPSYPKVKATAILDYVEAENDYFAAAMAPYGELIDTVFQEMKGRIKASDKSVPYKDGDWLYWIEYEEGADYKRWYRKRAKHVLGARNSAAEGNDGGSESQLILDEPALAVGKDYIRVSSVSVSPDGRILAFAVDDNGSERYEVRFRDLSANILLPDVIKGSLSSLVWAEGIPALFYGLANEQWRTDTIRLHRLGTPVSEDTEIYREAEIGFSLDVGKTADDRYVTIVGGDNETSEVRLIPASSPSARPKLVAARRKGREYSVEHREGLLYILTNDEHPNFRVATASIDAPDRWENLISGSDDFYITELHIFRDFFIIEGREEGLDQIEVRDYAAPLAAKRIVFPEPSYVAALGDNCEYHQDKLRITYESMVTPATVYDYDLSSGVLEFLKVQEIPSGYDSADYTSERISIIARDGTPIPVSLVHRKDRQRGKDIALHLYVYGSYGYAIAPGFSANRLSLIDRGLVYAIAHVRGGDDLGRRWYLAGKGFARKNSFYDVIDVAHGLIEQGYSRAGKISAEGRSAGGQIMGIICNEEPNLWGAVLAGVPFVDVINTMSDETLPLTPREWSEWGNPVTDKAAFEYMLSYSPYDNVRAQSYPPLFVSSGLNDPRVTYWEPTKWVAKLRAMRTNDSLLLLHTNMGAGHGGKSGRWQALRETAEEYVFVLTQLGVESTGSAKSPKSTGSGSAEK